MTVGGSHAGAEIMLLTILSGARFVEVPVNYLPRVGVSSVTGSHGQGDRRRAADDPARVPASGAAAPAARDARRPSLVAPPPR